MPTESETRWDQSGWATYAAIMMFGGGIVGMVNGVWALRYSDLEANLVLGERNLDLWGSVALIGGVLLLTAGIGAFTGKSWARWTGIVLNVGTVAWNVGWAEIQPIQSLIGALLAASVIYALAAHPVTVETGG